MRWLHEAAVDQAQTLNGCHATGASGRRLAMQVGIMRVFVISPSRSLQTPLAGCRASCSLQYHQSTLHQPDLGLHAEVRAENFKMVAQSVKVMGPDLHLQVVLG
jgi:hypothetical protein